MLEVSSQNRYLFEDIKSIKISPSYVGIHLSWYKAHTIVFSEIWDIFYT